MAADPHVLSAQRVALRPFVDACRITFVQGGRDARAELDRRRIDLVVTPLRMPGVDGAEVLRHAACRRPEAVRLLLVQERDRGRVAATADLAHRVLASPVPPERLCAAIARVLRFQERMRSPELAALVARVKRLPPHPRVYFELTRALEDRATRAEQIAQIIARDPALGARTLQLVNTGFYASEVEITNIARAVTFLGVRAVRSLVLVAEVERAFHAARVPASVLDRVQARGVEAARLALRLRVDPKRLDAVVAAALLHDLGALLLSAELPEAQSGVRKRVAKGEDRQTVEREVHGVCHAAVGAYLLALWGVPQPVVEAVAFHHAPWEVDAEGRDELDRVGLVYLASGVAEEIAEKRPVIDEAWVQENGWTAQLEQLRAVVEVGSGRAA